MAELNVKEAATRKIGPLPAWMWAVALGGAFLLVRTIKGGGGSVPVTPPTADNPPSPISNDIPVSGGASFDITGLSTQIQSVQDALKQQETRNLQQLQGDLSAKQSQLTYAQSQYQIYTTKMNDYKTKIADPNTTAAQKSQYQIQLTEVLTQRNYWGGVIQGLKSTISYLQQAIARYM